MMSRRTGTLMTLIVGAWLLAACANAAPTKPADSLSTSGGLSDPADGSLLKADRDGLFRWRAESGWENIDIPQNTFGLSGVIINPDQPRMIYASGPGFGVIRSGDSGQNWQSINTGLSSLDVTALALHSFRRDTLYAWVRGEGVYRTEDGGATWGRMPDQGPPDKEVRGLTHSTLPGSMNTGWLYAATPTGAYLSMDCF